MDKAYYLQYFDYERKHWWFRARNNIIISILRKYSPERTLKVLNIGAATGYTSQLLEDFGQVISIEYDQETCTLTKEKTKIDIRHGTALNLRFENEEFDIVCAFDVIEHIKEDTRAIQEMYRVCKKDGLIFITVPAYNFLWSTHDDINHHIKRYTKRGLLNNFKELEVQTLYTSYFNHFLFFPIAMIRILQSVSGTNKKIKNRKSDFEKFTGNNILNQFLKMIFLLEKPLLRSGLPLPFGVSLMSVIQCKPKEQLNSLK